jgi:hypothetical protein
MGRTAIHEKSLRQKMAPNCHDLFRNSARAVPCGGAYQLFAQDETARAQPWAAQRQLPPGR